MSNIFQVRADALFVYPIKSCGGVRVPFLRFTEAGTIEMDREWVVVDSNGDVVWQGSHPRLALVRPIICDSTLVLHAPGISSVETLRSHAKNACLIRIWNDIKKITEDHEGFDAGLEAAALLRAVTGSDLRLIRLAESAISRDAVNPIHLCSASSMYELNQTLIAQGSKPVDIIRLRPNIVIGNLHSPLVPFIEEQFTAVSWIEEGKEANISFYGPCIRCVVPNVDPVTSEVGDEPAKAIATLSGQRYPGEPSHFGVYGRAGRRSCLREGTSLKVELNF
jgi:hypothetical protein